MGAFLMLLPFFVLPVAADMSVQFDFPKLMGIFLVGNLMLCSWLARIDFIFAVIHGGITISTVITGFGPPQLYFFVYWASTACFARWFITLGWEGRDRLLGFVVMGGVLVAAHGYLQVFWHDPILQYAPGIDAHRPIAFLRQHTLLGAFEAPVCCLALALRRWKSAIFIAPILVFAHSNFTLLAFGAGLLVIMVDRRETESWLVLLLPVAAVIMFCLYELRPQTFYSHGRVEVWRETLTWWWHHARWIGSGGGSFRVLFPPRLLPDGTLIPNTGIQSASLYEHGAFLQAHNDYVQALFEFGLMGAGVLLFTLSGVIQAFWNASWWKNKPGNILGCHAMLAALMANAIGNFPWQLAPHCLLGVISLAVVLHTDDL